MNHVLCSLCGGNQGFRWHHIGEHRRATNASALNQSDISAKLTAGESGFVAAWAATDNDNVVISD